MPRRQRGTNRAATRSRADDVDEGSTSFRSSGDECHGNISDLSPELPPVTAIPFNLDLATEGTTSTSPLTVHSKDIKPSTNLKQIGLIAGLPIVQNCLKGDRLGARNNARINLPLRKPKNIEKGDVSFNSLAADVERTLNINEWSDLDKQTDSLELRYLDDLVKTQLEIIAKYKKGGSITMIGVDGKVEILRKEQSAISSSSEAKENDGQTKFTFISSLYSALVNFKEIDSVKDVVQRWTELKTPGAAGKTTKKEIANLMKVSDEAVERLEFFRDSRLLNYMQKSSNCDAVFPDIFKMLAFNYWQRNDAYRCIYLLTCAHGMYVRNDMCDRYSSTLSRMAERDENCKTDLASEFIKYMNNLNMFAQVQTTDFRERLNEIDPNWTVVQLTTMFHYNNRFSTDVVDPLDTPELFLTCFSHIPGTTTNAMFTTIIPSALKYPGITNRSLIEEFGDVMVKNRNVSGNFVGRKAYWDIRGQHNTKLSTVLAGIEENWIFPWNFLLVGSLVDEFWSTKVISTVRIIELNFRKRLTSMQKLVLIKLVGGYSFLLPIVKQGIGHMLHYILDDFMFPVQDLAKLVIKVGSSIPADQERHPTVFILDQEIEQLPWECLTCMRKTASTRIQSMSILYSTMKKLETRDAVDETKCLYVLNPDGSLASVQKRLEAYLTNRTEWSGVVGVIPEVKLVDTALQEKDIYLYCGHGSGQCIYPDYSLQKIICKAVALLMGCTSASYRYHGPKSASYSVLTSYATAMCVSVVGFLWEVTDVECDRVTVSLLEHWVPSSEDTKLPHMPAFDSTMKRERVASLPKAVLMARNGATQFLTQAGLVNYGLPINSSYKNKEKLPEKQSQSRKPRKK